MSQERLALAALVPCKRPEAMCESSNNRRSIRCRPDVRQALCQTSLMAGKKNSPKKFQRQTGASMSELQVAISQLRRTLAKLERLGVRDGRPLDQQILDALTDCGPSTTSAVVRIVRRRAGDVRATLKLLHETNRVRRSAEGKWSVDHV